MTNDIDDDYLITQPPADPAAMRAALTDETRADETRAQGFLRQNLAEYARANESDRRKAYEKIVNAHVHPAVKAALHALWMHTELRGTRGEAVAEYVLSNSLLRYFAATEADRDRIAGKAPWALTGPSGLLPAHQQALMALWTTRKR